METRLAFLLILIQISLFDVCRATEIKDCFYIEYNPYFIQLVCDDSVQKDSCFSSVFGHHSHTYVRLLKTGNCKGNRLNETLPGNFANVQTYWNNLQTYDISFHGIDAITSDDLNFPSLRIFNTSHNELSNIPGSLFMNTPQIFEVDFSFNKITEISADAFKGATKLLKISLSHNELLTLSSEMFVGLNELNKLELKSNLIESIEKNTFQNNHKLEILYLENNPMKKVDCNIFYQFTSSIVIYVSWANVDEFDANCMRGRSSLQIEFSNDKVNFRAMRRDRYIYPLPVIMGIKGYPPNIKHFNITGNRVESTEEVIEKLGSTIETLDASVNFFTKNSLNGETFRKLINLKHLNLSHTQISSINCDSFSSLSEIISLDLSGNSIKNLDENSFRNNSKLKVLYLENNPLVRIDCNILWPLKNSVLVHITWDTVKELDTSCLKNSFEIEFSDVITLRVKGSNTNLKCTKTEFKSLESIRFAENHLENMPKVIEELGTEIETLDISSNFVGELKATTFEKLNSLQHLNLSNTQLSNFGFSTFYHQNKLKSLDISYNGLRKVDFTLLFRNFKSLTTLNLEGNALPNIDSVTCTHFPKLSSLGLSKNNFSCRYLAKFLLPWQNLRLFHSPSIGSTHIDGVDCVHDIEADRKTNEAINSSTEQMKSVNMPSSTERLANTAPTFDMRLSAENKLNLLKASAETESPKYILEELRALKYLIIIVCCGYLMMKFRVVQRIKQRITRNSMENTVAYRQDQEEFYA